MATYYADEIYLYNFNPMQDWSTVQKMCGTLGHEGLNRRILELEVEDLHPEIVARTKQIVKPLKHTQVQMVSAGAASFHVWVGRPGLPVCGSTRMRSCDVLTCPVKGGEIIFFLNGVNIIILICAYTCILQNNRRWLM